VRQAQFYKTLDRDLIASEVRKEGFDPLYIEDPPGHVYPPHRHPATKLVVFLKGSMEVEVAGQKYSCLPGDKLIIPGNVEHAAVVGSAGCSFFWSEKL
jgi:quercetin dioxygenase-like cupin family protein